jgi:organic hydroperoxide reductase OsmC/OhrA
MTQHLARVHWIRGEQAFVDNRYSRVHEWRFDGGATVHASASPSIVRAPMSDPSAVDPEEAFVAALSSCHMLWFLDLASRRGFVVDSYEDEAAGALARLPDGRSAMSRVVLRPRVAFSGPRAPTRDEIDALHEEAHRQCFLAAAVNCEMRVEAMY